MRYNTKSRLRNRNRNSNNKPNRGSKRKPAKRTNSKNKRSRVRRRTVKGGANEGAPMPTLTVTYYDDKEQETIETVMGKTDKRTLGPIVSEVMFKNRGIDKAKKAKIKTVQLGSGIKEVFSRTFLDFKNLETVILNEELEKILLSAFTSSGVKTINLPKSLKIIGNGAFQECKRLKSIEIPDSVTSIGDGAFYECTGLETLIINRPPVGEELTINIHAFFGCKKLSSIEFKGEGKKGIIKIRENAFGGCCKLGLLSSTDVINLPKEEGQILIIDDQGGKRKPKDTEEIKKIITGKVKTDALSN